MERMITPLESTAKAHRGAHGMSNLNVVLVLVGAHAGKTIKHHKLQFVDGECEVQGTVRAIDSIAKYYGRCFNAHIRDSDAHRAAVAAQEEANGSDEAGKDAGGGAPKYVQGGDGPDGTGSTETPADDGKSATESGEGNSGVSTAGDGHEDPRIPLEDPFKERLYQAVMSLDKGNDEHWSADTLQPRIDAISEIYGSSDVTREQVDEVAPGLTRETMPDPVEDAE